MGIPRLPNIPNQHQPSTVSTHPTSTNLIQPQQPYQPPGLKRCQRHCPSTEAHRGRTWDLHPSQALPLRSPTMELLPAPNQSLQRRIERCWGYPGVSQRISTAVSSVWPFLLVAGVLCLLWLVACLLAVCAGCLIFIELFFLLLARILGRTCCGAQTV